MENVLKGSSLVSQKRITFNPKRFASLEALGQKSAHVANSLLKRSKKGTHKKIAIISYSLFGHNISLAELLHKNIIADGGKADIFAVPHSVYTKEELESFGALVPKYPTITVDDLLEYDAFLFGFPSRFGNMNTEWAVFWESTEPLMHKGLLFGKPFGTFASSATPGGGIESVQMNVLSLFIYQGMVYVPIGSQVIQDEVSRDLNVNFGGSPWGSETFTSSDGTRVLSRAEQNIVSAQAKHFYSIVKNKF